MTGRGLRGRRLARLLLVAALALDALLALLIVGAPTTMGGSMGSEGPFNPVSLVPAIGVALNIIGLAWMIRIYRSDPEAHRSNWRSHIRT